MLGWLLVRGVADLAHDVFALVRAIDHAAHLRHRRPNEQLNCAAIGVAGGVGRLAESAAAYAVNRQTNRHALLATLAIRQAERPRSAAGAAGVGYEVPETNVAAPVCCSTWFGLDVLSSCPRPHFFVAEVTPL